MLPEGFSYRQFELKDVPPMIAMEEICFPPNERATPEKVLLNTLIMLTQINYRVGTCPEMSLGIFRDDQIIGMIHGTRTSDSCASDKSMAVGSHEPDGPTAVLHTLCVHPDWRLQGFGTAIVKEYFVRVRRLGGVERVALIAHDDLVPFYERYSQARMLIQSRICKLRTQQESFRRNKME